MDLSRFFKAQAIVLLYAIGICCVLSGLSANAGALIINWPHDEGANNAVIGYSDLGAAYDQNATLQGGAAGWLTNCMDGGCYSYSSEDAIIPDSYIHLDNWTSWTVGAWINKTTQHGYFFSDGHFAFRADVDSFACGLEDDILLNTSSTVIDDGVFHHLACSWNGTCLNLYYEGTLNGQTCQEHLVYNYTGNTCIGSNCASGGTEAKVVDALFVTDRVLTDAEIYTIYDGMDGAPTTTQATTSSSEISSSSSSYISSSSSSAASTTSSSAYSSSSAESSSSSEIASTSSSELSSSSSSEASTTSSSSFESSSSAASSALSAATTTTTLLFSDTVDFIGGTGLVFQALIKIVLYGGLLLLGILIIFGIPAFLYTLLGDFGYKR